ncbi:redoxin domain-containing protein [Flagellimonas pacifica]|uniref:AhpC/TSA family protein n=1 Tax=Flagellimonas pacifica TaxID=1247520 RepID=A0A285MDQ4_9FLAO|nr:redoxin domain-containing protein [Allomuricauda parva]SNY95302.1 AhpC/TSA family protein [Allomuricauda parva]
MENEVAQNYTMQRMGDVAPDFEALSNKGNIKPSEYAGDKWFVLFSYPAGFTSVCTTECKHV